MKKILLSLFLALGLASAAQAQVEIGLKVSPSLGYNRFTSPAGIKVESDGARVHFGGGLVIDYFFGENYAFSTGLELMGKGGKVKSTILGVSSNTSEVGLQYLQVPIALKLFTNEVAPDTRVYFQVGGEIGALLSAKVDGDKTRADGVKYSKSFNTPEIGALLGAGAELQMGKSTKVFGGLAYHHGLTNIADNGDDSVYKGFDKLKIQNSYITLDVGLKF